MHAIARVLIKENFFIIKNLDLDPDPSLAKFLDPDLNSVNSDPKHWLTERYAL